MSDLKKEKAIRDAQTMQLFDTIEKPIMRFISDFTGETVETIFSEDLPDIEMPLILMPIAEYKPDICVKFTIKTVEPGYKLDINHLLEYSNVKDAIGFLYYGVKSVYASIVATTLINKASMVTTAFELDKEHWTFNPVYAHKNTAKKIVLEYQLGDILYKREEMAGKPDELKKIASEYDKVIKQIMEINKLITPEIIEREKKVNEEYATRPRLGIVVEEIHKNEMPKQKIRTNNNNLPVVSTKSAYT
jgi:hypothetical protein